jgi:hypothetical protein
VLGDKAIIKCLYFKIGMKLVNTNIRLCEKPGMAVLICNPSYSGRGGRRIVISRPAQEKLA